MALKLTKIPDTNDFTGPSKASVKLEPRNQTGGHVLFKEAKYDGETLVPDGSALSMLTFTIKAGDKILNVVFTSLPTSAEAELHEVDGFDSQRLRSIAASEPFTAIRIVGS